jgi:hypothetical protein
MDVDLVEGDPALLHHHQVKTAVEIFQVDARRIASSPSTRAR